MFLPDENLIKSFVAFSVEDAFLKLRYNLAKLALVLGLILLLLYFIGVSFSNFGVFCYLSFCVLLLASLYGYTLKYVALKRKKLTKIIKEGKYRTFVFLFASKGLRRYSIYKCCTVLHFFDMNNPKKTIRIFTDNKHFIKFSLSLENSPFTMLVHNQYPDYFLPLDYLPFLVKRKNKEKAGKKRSSKFI